MKKNYRHLFTFVLLYSSFCISYSQYPSARLWDHDNGGDYGEMLNGFQQTSDGGFILGGYTASDSSGSISQQGNGVTNKDYWMLKTDFKGRKQWDKRFGGNLDDGINFLQQTADGGYILGGFTTSDSGGDVSQPNKGCASCNDFWVVKTNALGNKVWDKRYGGDVTDILTALEQTTDGGYLLGGYTNSDSTADVTQRNKGNQGGYDFWVVRIDSSGNKKWDARYGGFGNDYLSTLQQTTDGGFILGGEENSDSTGDISQHTRGGYDYWIVKINAAGQKQWDKRFGGAQDDGLTYLQQTFDKGFILGGITKSDIGGDVSQPKNSATPDDYWIVKTDSLGNKQWDRRFGGTNAEDIFGYVRQTVDSGYLLSGCSLSRAGGDKSENNLNMDNEPWLLKIDANGNKVWDKTIQSPASARCYAIQENDKGYIVASTTYSDSAGYKLSKGYGGYDFWLAKFGDSSLVFHCNLAAPQITTGNTIFCSYDSTRLCAPSGFSKYMWNTGSTATCVETNQAGNYYVIVTDTNGCTAQNTPIVITVYPAPTASINIIGDTLLTSVNHPVSYQWCRDGTPVGGANNSLFIGPSNGFYSVSVTDVNGCVAVSDMVAFTIVLPSYQTIAAGGGFARALCNDGSVQDWGLNAESELGDYYDTQDHYSPVPVFSFTDAIAINGIGEHTVALERDGHVWSWGYDAEGQLGDGTRTPQGVGVAYPVPALNLYNVAAISGGAYHSVALKTNGTVYDWGYDSQYIDTPRLVTGLNGIVAISAIGDYNVALRYDSTVWVWGVITFGQWADSSVHGTFSGVKVKNLSGVVTITGGNFVLKSDSTIWRWGGNLLTPVKMPGISSVKAIASGYNHILALKDNGTLWAYGDNSSGELGLGNLVTDTFWHQIPFISNVVEISASGGYSMAKKSDGSVWTWGLNDFGQAGNDTASFNGCMCQTRPVQVVTGLCTVLATDTSCHARFAIVQDSVNPGRWLAIDQSAGTGALNYTWYWGDGNGTSTGAAPSHIYQGTGNYEVCLSISAGNCNSSFCNNLFIPPVTTCAAHFTLYPDTTILHHWFALNQVTGTPPFTYSWNWGDGSSPSTGATPSHIYSAPAFYNICLTITDSTGCTSTYCDSSTYLRETEGSMITINVVTQLPAATGIARLEAERVLLYPNPSVSSWKLEVGNELVGSKLEVYDAEGRVVWKSEIRGQKSEIQVQVSSGVYWLRIYSPNVNIIRKLVRL